ncbi:hypothetical protein QR680_003142 [Steinernema hermaphroditum]|uniref:Uncharacterized protein n=1 Tax=Steinernema hermaphroditum TaxID=289476 RepID=A0AA39H7F1_9BILA|nr:hypothetical protein QR680_003142 [Steinernema hermaphroditum]
MDTKQRSLTDSGRSEHELIHGTAWIDTESGLSAAGNGTSTAISLQTSINQSECSGFGSSHCFRLNDFKENRYVVLERLAPSVIQPSHSPEVPPAKAVQLVTCLMDHESRVFAVPERLLKAVADEAVAKPSAESNATPNRSTLSSAPAVSPDRQYCTVVDKNEYKSQETRA